VGSSEHWLTDRPAELISGTGITLRRWSAGDAGDLVEAVNDTLDELRPWMPWAQQAATQRGIRTVLDSANAAWNGGREFSYTIRRADALGVLAGCCGLHNRIGVGGLEIGYWVRTGHMGRGIATDAARLLSRSAFALAGVERVEIHCDQANARSAAIPRKLGFRLERIEPRPPETPGQSDKQMIWIRDVDDPEGESGVSRPSRHRR
jgi:RimJ/RimL family protein N-acetyltransferase